MSARSIVESSDAPVEVTLRVRGDGAAQLRGFLEGLASICNAGSSRRIVIEDPTDERQRKCHWSFDGDGNTRIEVVSADGREGGE